MPAKIVEMDPDTLVAERDGMRLYAKDFDENAPLYRALKLITSKPWIDARKTAHVAWIVHKGRLQHGGDCWLMQQHCPELRQWIESECALSFDPQYIQDTIGASPEEYQALVEAENNKYRKK